MRPPAKHHEGTSKPLEKTTGKPLENHWKTTGTPSKPLEPAWLGWLAGSWPAGPPTQAADPGRRPKPPAQAAGPGRYYSPGGPTHYDYHHYQY